MKRNKSNYHYTLTKEQIFANVDTDALRRRRHKIESKKEQY